MTKINKSALSSGRKQVYENSPSYEPSSYGYPIKDVLSLSYKAEVSKRDDLPIVSMTVKGRLEVFDSRDNVPFEYPFSITEETEILDEEDGESVGFIMPGNSFDLDELALLLVKSSLPIKLLRKENSETEILESQSDEEEEPKIKIKGIDY